MKPESITGERFETLPKSLMAEIYLRSLTLQASWNSQRMQNLGLLVSLLPWLRHNRVSRMDRRRYCRRHYAYFNTNPYFANFIIGGLLRLESAHYEGNEAAGRQIEIFKSTLARSIASLGDQLFWLGLKPATLLVVCIFALWGRIWLTLGVVVLFGIWQLILRRQALAAGYRLGLDIVDLLARPVWHRTILLAKWAGMLLTGVLAGFYTGRLLSQEAGLGVWPFVGMALLTVMASLRLHPRCGGEGALLLALPLALALAYV